MNQRIGYARVSTDDQHLDLQRDALMQAGCGVIYEEAASGKSAARPELEQCRKALRAGDTLARLGGDEFVVVLTDLNSVTECELVLERLLRAAASSIQIKGQALQLSASLGVTLYPGGSFPPRTVTRSLRSAAQSAQSVATSSSSSARRKAR